MNLLNYRNKLLFFSCLLLVQALAWSKFLLSVSIILLLVGAFAKKITTIKVFFKNKGYWVLTIPFFMVLISGIWTEDWLYFSERIRIKLPLLLLPLAFSLLPKFENSKKQLIFYAFILSMTLTSLRHITYFMMHYDEVIAGLGQGHPIPTLHQHIAYLVMLVFALFAAFDLWLKKNVIWHRLERPILLLISIYLFATIHLLAVRSGIVILYSCLIFSILYYIIFYKKIKEGILVFTLFALGLYAAIAYIPSLHRRIEYMSWDLKEYNKTQYGQRSDTDRILSLKIGWQVFENNLIWGVGMGDVRLETKKIYAQQYPYLEPRDPHSGILFTAIGMGIFGLLGLFYTIGFQFYTAWRAQNLLFLVLNIAFLIINTIDYVFEGTYNVIFYAFFVCLFSQSSDELKAK